MRDFLQMIGKISLLLIFYGLHTQLYAQLAYRSTNSPDLSIDQGEKERSLKQVLLEFQQEYKVDIFFTDEIIDNKVIQENKVVGGDLEKSLENILMPLGLKYEKIREKVYVVNEDKRSPVKEVKKNSLGETTPHVRTHNLVPAYLARIPAQLSTNSPLAIRVSGRVTDENSEGLPGVNVLIKGTSQGTVTDVEGNYALEVPSTESILVFTSVGYVAEEVVVGNQTAIDINLNPDIQALEEIVVIGYGTQEKRDITGAVSSISGEDLERVPVNNPQQLVQGRAAGVQVQQTGGDLEGRFEVLVRGINSTGSNGPLYVVDGVPLATGSFSTINPSDIASIDILKDASATAIYGARASNGVVVITTKTGTSGRTSVNLEVKYGIEKDIKRLDMMNTSELLEFSEQAYINNEQTWPGISDELADNDYDWQDLMLQTGSWQEYNLSVNGGNEKTQFVISGSYLDRKGILIGTNLNRASFRSNIDHEVTSKLKIGVRLTNSFQKGNNAVNDGLFPRGFRQATFSRPWNPYQDENGNYIGIPNRSAPNNGPQENHVAVNLEEVRENRLNRLLGNAFAEYEIINGLSARFNFGVDLINGNNYTYLPVYDRGGYQRTEGSVTQSNSTALNYVTDLTLTYTKAFDKHNLTGLLGFSTQKFINQNFSVAGNGTTNNNLDQISNQPNITGGSGGETHAGLVSYFARLNYAFNDKYLLTATVRRDGSSRFGPNNKFGTFPSGSIAWRISEESFMQGISVIDDLKIRTSYGLTGNQAIGNFQYLATTASANYVFGDTEVGGIRPNSFANENIQWETNKQFDVGFDLALFEGRLSVSADYYDKKSEDLLIVIPKPPSTGIPADPTVNLGSISNKGFEFSFTSRNLVQQFKWSTTFNITANKNEVLNIGKNALGQDAQIPGYAVDGFLGGIAINLTTAGQPIGAFYTHQWDGIWQLDEEAEAAVFGLEPGDSKYVDLNDDDAITLDDRSFAGQPMPKFYGGMDNTFNYKNFTLSVFLNWQYGNKMFNQLRQFIESGQPAVNALDVPYWTAENPSNIYPRPLNAGRAFGENSRPSTRFLEDASFLRVKNVSLSYDLSKEISQKIGFYSARLAFNVTNLATITNYSGFDPESSSGGILSGGLDLTPYPLARTYMFTLNLGF